MEYCLAVIVTLVTLCLSSMANETVYDPPRGAGMYRLTPPESPAPRINGPAVFGVRPGSPFLYTIPASGRRPMKFSVEGLPDGLILDEVTGRITGNISDLSVRDYPLVFHVENELGSARKTFRIKVGDPIGLAPPLGWNSWNCWGHRVSQENVLASARAMVDKGLIHYGWTYINIDDTWQGKRGGPHQAILPDPDKFPDMKKLCDDVHALGLKIGIYSTPWVTSYAGYIGGSSDNPSGDWNRADFAGKNWHDRGMNFRYGRYSFATNDAAQWAEWGIDYLKYDWRPNDTGNTVAMADALENSGRDIIYSLSNNGPVGSAKLFEKRVQCWRTTGDLKDRWDSPGPNMNLLQVWEMHRAWLNAGTRGGPGHFPDADMLVVGQVVERNQGESLRPSRLTADEQYTHISLWALWSCPLLIGCPIEQLDDFTLGLLANAEVLDVQQDERGIAGDTVYNEKDVEIIVKTLADESRAIGLFNRNGKPQIITVDWRDAGLDGKQIIRDLWRQKDLGVFEQSFSANVPAHGVVLVRAEPQK
ncbi:MAG: putative Ig domain-containing protein [Kiritimatiellales bacterium]